MAYLKISTPCVDAAQLIGELKSFVLANTTFTDAGNITSTAPCFKSPENYYYSFNFSATQIETCITKVKPASTPLSSSMAAWNSALNNTYSLAKTTLLIYPMLSRSFFTNGKLVAMVMEIAAGVYAHHVFGKYDTLDVDGGEYVGGTIPSTSYSMDNGVRIYRQLTSDSNWIASYAKSTDTSESNGSHVLIHPVIIDYTTGQSSIEQGCNYMRFGDIYVPCGANAISNDASQKDTRWFCTNQLPTFHGAGANNYNGRTMLYPIMINLWKPYAYSYPLTTVPQYPAFYTDMIANADIGNFLPEDVINNEWVIFPLVTKSTSIQGRCCSVNYGVAYKK